MSKYGDGPKETGRKRESDHFSTEGLSGCPQAFSMFAACFRAVFLHRIYEGQIRMTERDRQTGGTSLRGSGAGQTASAAGYTTCRDIVAVPVADGKRFNTYPRSGLGTVHKVVLTDVNARVISGTRNPEHHNVAGAEVAAPDALSGTGLIPADAGNGNAVSGTGPVDKAGAVETSGGRSAPGNIGATKLTLGCGSYGRTAARRGLRGIVGGAIRLFAAGGRHKQGRTQKQKGKEAKQRMSTKCRHGSPAGVK